MYPEVNLFIDGTWGPGAAGKTLDVMNPATGELLGKLAHAGTADLDRALGAAGKGLPDLAQDIRLRALQGDAQGRPP